MLNLKGWRDRETTLRIKDEVYNGQVIVRYGVKLSNQVPSYTTINGIRVSESPWQVKSTAQKVYYFRMEDGSEIPIGGNPRKVRGDGKGGLELRA